MTNNGTVLLIEDNAALNEVNVRALRLSGYSPLAALSLAEARAILAVNDPEVILLDVMLPDGNGFDFCTEIRGKTSAHILFLTARTEQEDLVRGLTGGGDDYITKPYHPEELMARIGAAMRRRNISATARTITKGALTFDIVAARATFNGDDLTLAPKDFALLLLFAQNENRVLNPETISQTIWKQPTSGDNRALQAAISRLRKKLPGCGYTISTKRGEGYSFERGTQ